MHGIFDSGLGGLSVLRQLRKISPNADLIYYADQIHVPYGELSPEETFIYVKSALTLLEQKGATSVTLACHTVSTTIANKLRREFSFPIFDIASHSLSQLENFQRIAVIGTRITIESGYYQNVLGQRLHSATACPKLAPMVESGQINERAIQNSLAPILPDPDCIILACTHYPFLSEYISKIFDKCTIVDPSIHFAGQVPLVEGTGRELFFTTGDETLFKRRGESLLNRKLSLPFSIKPLYFVKSANSSIGGKIP